jgi:outer membrane protein assembly factor BamD
LSAGCPSVWQSKATESAEAGPEQLYKRAEELYGKKSYSEAADVYQKLRSAYPDFDKIAEVYERLGDAFFNADKYEEAISRYRQFIELYPNHKDRARAKYMVGMAFFKQVKGKDLDNSVVERAEQAFKEVSQDTEAGEWAKKAEEKYRECRKKLAEKELYKAETYLSMKNYKAAKIAAQRILDEFKDMGLDKDANNLIERLKGK